MAGKRKRALGVALVYDDETNMSIIAKRFLEDPDTTVRQVRFLTLCWSRHGAYERARKYYDWITTAPRREIEQMAARLNGNASLFP